MNRPHLTRLRSVVAASALVLSGFGGGALLALNGSADAATGSGSSGPSRDGHAGETPLSGTTAARVKAAVLAKYPGATVERLETDSAGVYEAHVVTKAGTHVIVSVGKDFTVTGTVAFGRFGRGGPAGPGGPGGCGGRPGDGPGRGAQDRYGPGAAPSTLS